MSKVAGKSPLDGADDREPTDAELHAIEVEWPEIEADLAVLDAQIRCLTAVGGPTSLDWRRLRRAERQLLAVRRDRAAGRPVQAGPEVA